MREFQDELNDFRLQASIRELRTALLRATLLFGAITIGLALVVVPAARKSVDYVASSPQLDTMTTGSIGANRYTVHRSVLQAPGAAPCIVHASGGRTGAC
ncbi:hypothetical protein [Aurantimonas endophytica]|uniref:Uncharacterized protein n=1 Tax=Aurantimonas endophytica TaxID=1522175 RepID=A0A7W6HIV1_9HYPH|nr:hypothetical protein [Aurantimonas endophytica]MBB4005731.1 hypothetical protein [Aurantimonas endophytica]MCO6406318.1 hypothetical protein [Aurantimonas endophytica]